MPGNVLDDLHDNAVRDNELLQKNDEFGDVFTKSREVEFAFRTLEKKRADDLAEFIGGKNFGVTRISGDDKSYWIFATIDMPITQNVICSLSGFMLVLAQIFGVEYDGWGSNIQRAEVVH